MLEFVMDLNIITTITHLLIHILHTTCYIVNMCIQNTIQTMSFERNAAFL